MTTGTLVLAGSGEFTDAMLETDRAIFSGIKKPVVAILPTAAGQEKDWWKWVDMGVAHYKKLGIEAYGVRLQNKKDTDDPDIVKDLSRATAFYFSGGDPGYVLGVMKNSSAWNYIHKRYTEGALLAGSSAGAMLMGSWILSNIYSVFDQGNTKYEWTEALNLVPYTIWPHFDFAMREFPDKIKQSMKTAPPDAKKNWLGIDEDTAVIFRQPGNPETVGTGTAHWGKL